MANARDTYGTVYHRGSAVLLARIAGVDATPLTRGDVSSIAYTISRVDPCSGAIEAVAGHDAAPLVVGEAVFDTLQTDAAWTADAVGYNFRHAIDVSSSEAFPSAGAVYRVRYDVQPSVGQRFVFRYELRAI